MVSLDLGSASKVDDVTALPCRADDVTASHIQDGGYALLWQRYDNKMAAICYYGNVILHLQQYSYRLNLLYLFFFLLSTGSFPCGIKWAERESDSFRA